MPYRIDPNTGQPVWDGTSIPQASRDSLATQIRSLQDQIDNLSFIDLDDVPATYTGQSGKIISVKSTEDGLEFITNTGGGGVTDGDKGDITVAGSGATWTIDASAVTEAKIADGAVTANKIGTGAVGPTQLASTSVTAGSYTLASITVDEDGRITSASSGTSVTPAGSGSELQFRNAGAFGAVVNSSVSSGTVTLGDGQNYGVTPQPLLILRNTTPATSGLQQVSPSIDLQTQGWTGSASTMRESRMRIEPFGTQSVNLVFEGRIGGSGSYYPLIQCQTNSGFQNWILGNLGTLQWSSTQTVGSSADLTIRRRSAANLQLGAIDAASPVAQTISVQNSTGTNASASSAVLTIDGAQGTGTAAGGDVRIRVAPNGSTGSTLNALIEALRVRATDLATVCAGAVVAGGPSVLASYTVSTVPSASLWTRGLIYVSDDIGGPIPAFSDGTNWRRVSDRAIVSTT